VAVSKFSPLPKFFRLVRVPCFEIFSRGRPRSLLVQRNIRSNKTSTMKISAAIALATIGGASAYSVNRSTLRSLGQKNVGQTSAPRNVGKSITMEGEFVARCHSSAHARRPIVKGIC